MIITKIFSFLLPAILFTISTIISLEYRNIHNKVKLSLMIITTAHFLALFNYCTLNTSIVFCIQLLIVVTNINNPKASKSLTSYFLFSLFLMYFNLYYA